MAEAVPQLDDPELYEREIRTLATRRSYDQWRATFELSAPLIAAHAPSVSERLAAEVSRGDYRFQPLIPHAAVLNGKPRIIYRVDPLDAVVWSALCRAITASMEPRLGSHVYSYRKGRSQWTACRALMWHLRAHVRARPDPRTRGMFVLRRDVKRYDENIRTDPDSTLWSTLKRLLGDDTLGLRVDPLALIVPAFRPPIRNDDGTVHSSERGMPTGLPTQTIACNVYLLPVDEQLRAITGGCYARFGDDVLFAHAELDAVREAARILDRGVEQLGLTFNPDKALALYLTRNGIAHPNAPEFAPTTHVRYLGFDVGFDGARLRGDKRRALWLSLRARLAHADRLLGQATAAERADLLCDVVRTAFDRRSPLCERYGSWLLFDVMSLEDLRQLDHHIALSIAERLTGRRGPQALRAFPPRVLHDKHGLPSLQHAFALERRRGRRVR